jgi:anti-anti-sigma factor
MKYPPFDTTTQFVSSVSELVRGQEEQFLEELQPIVSSRSVRLDLSRIERIDAAGLAALISVYCDACKAGHKFTVANPSRHVAEILSIVGLNKILNPQPQAQPPFGNAQLQETAA